MEEVIKKKVKVVRIQLGCIGSEIMASIGNYLPLQDYVVMMKTSAVLRQALTKRTKILEADSADSSIVLFR